MNSCTKRKSATNVAQSIFSNQVASDKVPSVAVAWALLEFAMRRTVMIYRCTLLLNFRRASVGLLMVAPLWSQASIVRGDIDYQIYRDFAENLGQFTPGATNIPIYKKDGTLLGIFNRAPMPDWSYTNHSGVTSLIDPQYVSTAKHTNGQHAKNQQYGGSGKNPDYHRFNYKSVARYVDTNYDYSLHRLNKLVTEVVPIDYIDKDRADINLLDSSRYPVFARIGNGIQDILNPDGTSISMAGPRAYKTGGFFGSPTRLDKKTSDWGDITIVYSGNSKFDYMYRMFLDTLTTFGQKGDSGSSLIAWDAVDKRWVLVGQYFGGSDRTARWMIPNARIIRAAFDTNNLPPFVTAGNSDIHWFYDSSSAIGNINQGQQTLAMTGASGADEKGLDNGKNIIFRGEDGIIIIHNSINQGAGSVTFDGNYTVKSVKNETWIGGGLDIKAGKTIIWQINGVKGDSLHKIGRGTLLVNAVGVNEGDLSAGDGHIILNQQADSAGKKQAFNSIDIVSGRPVVTINDAQQVNPNNIYFGFRGGRLDLNGNHLIFERIRNVDNGAQLVNYNLNKAALASIAGQASAANQTFQGVLGETDKNRANGKLSLDFNPLNSGSLLLLAGGSNLDGNISVNNGGSLVLSGRPVWHARADNLAGRQINVGEDWIVSIFRFNKLIVGNNSQLQIGEYTLIDAIHPGQLPEIELNGNASAVLGYHKDSTDALNSVRCYLDDNDGKTQCAPLNLDAVDNPNSVANINANIVLNNRNNILQFGYVNFFGSINDYGNAMVMMGGNTVWNMPGNSSLTRMMLTGTKIELGGNVASPQWTAKRLTIATLRADNAVFTLGMDATGRQTRADQLIVTQSFEGGNNSLNVVAKDGSDQANLPVEGLTIVTAPAGTKPDILNFLSTPVGFTLVSPLIKVGADSNDENKVKWSLLRGVSIADNTPVIQDTKILMESRLVAATEFMTHLTDRNAELRFGVGDIGTWGLMRQSKGNYGEHSFQQAVVAVGADRADGFSTTGIMANMIQGQDLGLYENEKHTQTGVGIYNSLGHGKGLFLDSALSYQRYHQKLDFASVLNNLSGTTNSNMLLMSARLGYAYKFDERDFFVVPAVGIDAAHLGGYKISNNVATIEQKSGHLIRTVFGLRASKHWKISDSRKITLSAGILRQQNAGGSTPGVVLLDAYGVRNYQTAKDNRCRFDLALTGHIRKNLFINLAISSSSGNHLTAGRSGWLQVSYVI